MLIGITKHLFHKLTVTKYSFVTLQMLPIPARQNDFLPTSSTPHQPSSG